MPFPSLLSVVDRTGPTGSSSRPKPSSRHASSSSSSSSSAAAATTTAADATIMTSSPEYIFDESQLAPAAPTCPDLRELNNALVALSAVFPDVQVEVFREMLSHFDGESRLAVCVDALLKNRVTWVKGRWKVVGGPGGAASPAHPPPRSSSTASPTLSPTEAFRSPEYKKAVKALAAQEFKGMSRSSISAVLAEHNYCYLEARRALVQLSSKSWRFAFSTFFFRRKPVSSAEAENHQLVVWRSSGHGSIIPTIKSTGNAELDRELFQELIRPLKEREKARREEDDHTLAVTLNNREAEEADATHECCCCFTTAPFEEFTTCNTEGHFICFRCVQHSLAEAVFGQGWQRSIDTDTGTLRCLSVDGPDCDGHIPSDHLLRAMLEEKRGAEILHKLDQRLTEHSLLASKLPLIRCPFCDYAEVDEIYLPPHLSPLRLRVDSLYSILFLLLCVGSIPFIFPLLLFSSFVCLLANSRQTLGDRLQSEWELALHRHRRRRRGLKFSCENPSCGRASCLGCAKAWVDVHVCHESALVALRTQVEQAMSMAIKRVCPRCNTSFVKTQGCNKLTCPCGYKMCYVCRRDIGGPDEGYRHFCEHFRPDGDPKPCTQCEKCNLWEVEDTEAVLRQAREEAEKRWLETEKRQLSASEKAFLETGVANWNGAVAISMLARGRVPSVADVCDLLVDTLFV